MFSIKNSVTSITSKEYGETQRNVEILLNF